MSDDQGENLNFFDPTTAANPQPVFAKIRQQCPVGHPIPGGPICLSRYDDVMFVLRNPKLFSSKMPVGTIGTQRPLIPLHLDPPEQTKYRKLLDPLFSRKNMLEMEDDVRALAVELIAKFKDDDYCEFNSQFAVPYPCTVFLRLMGLPQADLDLFLEMKDGIIRPTAPTLEEMAKVQEEAGQKIYAYFEDVLKNRRSIPKDDLLGRFLTFEVEGERLTDEDILDICYLFLIAGLDTVTATLGCSIANLAQHPERRQALVADPALIDSAVEELLRWETPVVQIVRLCTEDVEVGGVEIKAGEMVTLILGSADTDEAFFEAAGEVRLDREPNKHIAFGGGAHRCLGSHLARMELRVALQEIHRHVPVYRLKDGETPIYTPAIREVRYLPLTLGGED